MKSYVYLSPLYIRLTDSPCPYFSPNLSRIFFLVSLQVEIIIYLNLNIDDTDLFNAFKRGEPRASDKIFTEYFRQLCFFAERLSGNKEESEDVVADSFVKMLQRRESFENMENIKAFLYVTTRNACINQYKAGKRHVLAHRQMEYLLRTDAIKEGPFEEEIIRAEVIAEIYKEVENLPDRAREIFKMIFINGMSTAEIAQKLGIEMQTVRSQKARALQLLKAELLKKGNITALVYLISCFAVHN
ncbi:MAG TPA: RNA polymerase sigma-70 factor [Puia sp.]|nr:RNA polymerase sigma-70 factor [Puia sp.]